MKYMKHFRLVCLFSMIGLLLSSCDNSIEPNRKEVLNIMEKVADWQLANFSYREEGNLHDYGIGAWTNGVLYLGLSELATISEKGDVYFDWLYNIGEKSNWEVPANFTNYSRYSLYHADELCVTQFYINMYRKYKDAVMIESVRERLDWIIANPPSDDMSHRGKQSWTWCDALFMAPPVYANMAEIDGESSYLAYMAQEFDKTYKHLYVPTERLFYRDDSYFEKKEQNGENVFWGRGNGWVVAGLANLLKVLPKEFEKNEFYIQLYKDMIDRLIELRNADGFWHASLLDPASYPAPETSATAMITYAIAYGVNNGYLKGNQYKETALSSWKALVSVVNEDGKLGFVQPIGADPKKVNEEMTAVYGVGAFLLAGNELYKMK